ncbi:hypothetical protein [Gemmata sp.]|uniref:hypothetical protein n=1 Tax=Gemmata sp. TaxID=1914242 RepID=UPI003F6FA98F
MRPALLAGLVSLVAPTLAAAQAPAGPYLATVADAGTKLRAGPSDKFPETATLPKGFPVVVDHDEDGWLAVQDAPGRMNSVSWVQTQFINFEKNAPLPQLVEVDEAGTTLRAGQIGLAQPLPVQKARVPGGTILTVIGKGIEFEGKTWYPVVPPPGDFRYLPKQAVSYDKPAAAAFTVRDSVPEKSLPPVVAAGATGASPTGGTGTSVLSPPSGGGAQGTPAGRSVQNPLWAQAEAAERDGRLDDAEKIYFQLARTMNEPGGDHDTANLCYTRIHAIRERKRTGGPYPSAVPPASPPTPSNSPVRPTSLPPERPAPVTGVPPAPAAAEPRDERGKWTGPGRLVRSALAIDGRRTYALETSPGVVSVYIVAGQGVDLERFANKKVDVYGASATRRDLSKPFVVATAAEAAQ